MVLLKKMKHSKQQESQPSDSLAKYETLEAVDTSSYKYFHQFPLQKPTLSALKTNGFTKMTEIQKLVMKPILLGKDVVAEAATGSGKTLAFLVPVLDKLYTNRTTTLDGPVVIILTPTRELARQIAIVFKRFQPFFKFTMLNIMGGKTSLLQRHEWNSVSRANILIGTPGRLAQHQTENPLMDLSNLQMIVLDEADRLLDPTFRGDLDSILTNVTPNRQTLLFSATQSNTLIHLSRLCMNNPVIISTRSGNVGVLPDQLQHSYAVVPLEQKLDILWTFLQSHCKKKIIVFFSTQKQVRFTFELFQQLRPYFRVMQLRGNMQQYRRFQVYDQFNSTPHGCVLLATNLAERGLDFPAVDWVVQYDCPGQPDDYIHRAGRTARFGQAGRSITFLLPSELALVQVLQDKGVRLKMQNFPEKQIKRIVSTRAASILASRPELAVAARAAFTAYLRDYCMIAGSPATRPDASHPRIFSPCDLPLEQFSASLGLPSIPELPKRFLQWTTDRTTTSSKPTTNSNPAQSIWCQDSPESDQQDDFLLKKPEYASESWATNSGVKRTNLLEVLTESDEDSDRDPHPTDESILQTMEAGGERSHENKKKTTRVQLAKKLLRKKIQVHHKLVFDENDEIVGQTPQMVSTEPTDTNPVTGPLDVATERERLREITDKQDRLLWKERRREQNRLRRKKIKEERKKLQQKHQREPELSTESSSADESPPSKMSKLEQ